MKMSIFDKVLEIYKKYNICAHCLGRMFSLLGTNVTNIERGNALLVSLLLENHGNFLSKNKELEQEAVRNLKILAENANFISAQKVLEKEGIEYVKINIEKKCYLCQNMFSNVPEYVEAAKKNAKGLEFNTLLVGTTPDAQIINQEDRFKADFNILEAESFKSHFNREVGKVLTTDLNKEVEFLTPDVVFVFNIGFESFRIDLTIKPLFIAGKYQKLIRGIPQTRWICKNCSGAGCELCNFTGKNYETSVEELISPEFLKEAQATDSKFHGAGREDIDVRTLGSGRPFVLELKNPKLRTLNLANIMDRVNEVNKDKVIISNLRLSTRKEIIALKTSAETKKKSYKALVEAETALEKSKFEEKLNELKAKFENQKIHQRTPFRVSHRRADKVREKYVFKIDGEYINPTLYRFDIETQGGTYIKELITSDNGRTKPSFVDVFKCVLTCKELDVMNVE